MKALLFDLDGVLVDAKGSYEEAIRQTVRHFSGRTVSREHIGRLRRRGGLNNDWDLTEAILRERGRTVSWKEIQHVFQEFLLGDSWKGLIQKEKWLLKKAALRSLSSAASLGIVTSRPKKEAYGTLARFQVGDFFRTVVTGDDTPPGKSKPHPFGLLLALRRLDAREGWYVGDTVDDMEAATAAGLVPVAIVSPHAPVGQRRELLRRGARLILEDIHQILEVIP